jgi:hypothetical protein
MTKYACAVMVNRKRDDGELFRIVPFVVEATTRAEAIGLAYQVAEKAYPGSAGWGGYLVVVTSADLIVTPETVEPVEAG